MGLAFPTGGEAVVRALEEAGIRLAYGIPAVHNLPIYDALYGSKDIRSVGVRHEQGAGFMAIGSAYVTGEPTVCIVGAGPGATNMVTPAAEAYLDSLPMLVIAGGIRSKVRGKGALHEVDQLSIFRPVTKLSKQLTEPGELVREVRDAVTTCRSDRPAPVFLDIPFDVLASRMTQEQQPQPPGPRAPRRIDPNWLTRTSRSLEQAERPLIIIGGGVNSSQSWDEVSQLAESLGIPVASTISAKGAFPESSPLSVGQLWAEVAMEAAGKADVVLALGCRFSERSTAGWRLRIGGSLIQVDIDANELGRNYPTALAVPLDIREFLKALLKEVRPGRRAARAGWLESLAGARAVRDAKYEVDASSADIPVKPQRIIRELGEAISDETMVVTETGHAFWWSTLLLRIDRPRSFLGPSGNSTLGFGLPAALGAKCARPDRPVVCLVGDGGFLFTLQELLTAVEEKLPVVTIVIDDGGYSAIREYQHEGYGSRFIGVDFAVRPDYVRLAESLGASGVRVESPDDIRQTVRDALRSQTPTVIHIPISRNESALPRFLTDTYRRG